MVHIKMDYILMILMPYLKCTLHYLDDKTTTSLDMVFKLQMVIQQEYNIKTEWTRSPTKAPLPCKVKYKYYL